MHGTLDDSLTESCRSILLAVASTSCGVWFPMNPAPNRLGHLHLDEDVTGSCSSGELGPSLRRALLEPSRSELEFRRTSLPWSPAPRAPQRPLPYSRNPSRSESRTTFGHVRRSSLYLLPSFQGASPVNRAVQVGDKAPESIEQGEKHGRGAGENDHHRRVGNFLFGGPSPPWRARPRPRSSSCGRRVAGRDTYRHECCYFLAAPRRWCTWADFGDSAQKRGARGEPSYDSRCPRELFLTGGRPLRCRPQRSPPTRDESRRAAPSTEPPSSRTCSSARTGSAWSRFASGASAGSEVVFSSSSWSVIILTRGRKGFVRCRSENSRGGLEPTTLHFPWQSAAHEPPPMFQAT